MMQVQPEVRLMPQMFSDLPRCECHFGWNEETTHIFKNNHFHDLILSGGKGQDFILPDLGKAVTKVKSLSLKALGVVEGLKQFGDCVNGLYVTALPKNSIDISLFKNLNAFGCYWNKKIEQQVNELTGIDRLGIESYESTDLMNLKSIARVKELDLSFGNLTTLNGVNNDLEKLTLIRARNYSDVVAINTFHKLKWLECKNIKKAQGVIELGNMKDLVFVCFVDTGCVLDLEATGKLQSLEKLWSNGEHINIDWEQIIALPKLKMVGLFDDEVTDEQIISFAEQANKKIERLFRAGTKKKPHIQITFEDHDS